MGKWSDYLILAIIAFGGFFLELLSIGIIFALSHGQFGVTQKCIHLVVISIVWALLILILNGFSKKKYGFPEKCKDSNIGMKNWIIILVCLSACKVMTFIDWHTLKVIGEFKGKGIVYFSAQYLYYFFEVGLVCLVIIYGQKAFETRLKRKSDIPYGGLVLALTWGAMHVISRGTLDIWNGISCVIFSILSCIMYLKFNRNTKWTYIFVAIGYLL